MVLDPITSAFIGWVCGKLADTALRHLASSDLLRNDLDKAVAVWADGLPKKIHVNPAALFPIVDPTTAETERPQYYALQQLLQQQTQFPSEEIWLNVFVESWNHVKATVPEPQPFFSLSEQQAREHLQKLAVTTYNVCIQYEPLFKIHVANELREIKERLPIREKPTASIRLPGRVHNLPYGSIGGFFKGRDEILAELKSGLSGDRPTAITQTRTIHGLGGIGKSRLAVELAWQMLQNEEIKAAFFVVADTHANLISNFAELAGSTLLDLPEQTLEDQPKVIKAVLKGLAARDGYILIFDNADSNEARAELKKILPHLSSGRVLVTSRAAEWPGDVKTIPLDKLGRDDAVDYLLDKTDEKRAKAEDDKERASELATLLGGLPIALEQAAAYINHRRISLAQYIGDFNEKRERVLAYHGGALQDYPEAVLGVWATTEGHLDAAGLAILRLASFLAPEAIPVDLFESQPEEVAEAAEIIAEENPDIERPAETSGLDVRDVLSDLAAWSMVDLEGESFSVHRLLQDSVRLRMDGESRKVWTTLALSFVRAFFPDELPQSDDVRSWHRWRPMAPHVAAVVEHGGDEKIAEPTDWLTNELALHFQSRASYDIAEQLYRKALAICEETKGPEHTDTATCLNNLASLLYQTNRLKDAEPLYQKALEIDQKHFGPDHPKIAIRLNNLALLLKVTGRLDEAEPLYRRALSIDEKALGPDHPKIAIRLNNLASLLQDTGRLKQAEPLSRRALEIGEKTLGPDHPNVAIRLNNLAFLLKATGRKAGAVPLYERAVKIFEEKLGTEHPSTKTVRGNLEILRRELGRGAAER